MSGMSLVVLCITGHAKQKKILSIDYFGLFDLTLSVIPLKRRAVFHGEEGRPEDIAGVIRCCA